MAYTIDDIKTLVSLLTPLIKAELETGSLGVEDLRMVDNLDHVNSLPALEEIGMNPPSVVKAPLKLLIGKLEGDYAAELKRLQEGIDRIDKEKGTANITTLSYEEYLAIEDKNPNTLYACLDKDKGEITRAFVGIYPFSFSGGGGSEDAAFPYMFPFVLH